MDLSNDELLKRCLHGKTQNTMNQSITLFGKDVQKIFTLGEQSLK